MIGRPSRSRILRRFQRRMISRSLAGSTAVHSQGCQHRERKENEIQDTNGWGCGRPRLLGETFEENGAYYFSTEKRKARMGVLSEPSRQDRLESRVLLRWGISMAPRANWKGFLRLSLVTCPVALYPATSDSEKISFNQINRNTGHRIKYLKVDADTGEEVSNEDIMKGHAHDRHQRVCAQARYPAVLPAP